MDPFLAFGIGKPPTQVTEVGGKREELCIFWSYLSIIIDGLVGRLVG